MADHELLEMFLYYSIPRRNTNEIAHRMICAAGSLSDVFGISTDRIRAVDGVGEETLTLIELTRAINRRSHMGKYSPKKRFTSLSLVGEYLTQYYNDVKQEQFCAMLFDNGMKLIDFVALESGSANSVSLDTRRLAKTALYKDATSVIIAHNHPSGPAMPSAADHEMTARAEAALSAIGISLLEHIIVGEMGYTPTMQARLKTFHSLSRSHDYEIDFLREFYST